MHANRGIRRQALQLLCQFDAGNEESADIALQAIEEGDAAAPSTSEDALSLAQDAWSSRQRYDELISARTPQWPTHRQPLVDRNLLRLCCHEMLTGRTPPRVVINEAVELAREFSTDRSPSFVNGVLDRIYHDMDDAPGES